MKVRPGQVNAVSRYPIVHTGHRTVWSASTIRFAAKRLKKCYEIKRICESTDAGHVMSLCCLLHIQLTIIKPLFTAAASSPTAASDHRDRPCDRLGISLTWEF